MGRAMHSRRPSGDEDRGEDVDEEALEDEEDEGEDDDDDSARREPAPRPGSLRPAALAPLFVITALFHLVAVATRFPELAAMLPPALAPAILLVTFPLLMIEGYAEGRIDYGGSSVELPLWMRIQSRPVRWSFTFAFTYLGVVALQTWQLSIGPLDPTPPAGAPLTTRLQLFAMMTVVMAFPNYLAACSVFIPALRIVTAPFRRLPTLVSLVLLPLVGLALGQGLLYALGELGGATLFADVQRALKEDPVLTVAALVGSMLLPSLLTMLPRKAS